MVKRLAVPFLALSLLLALSAPALAAKAPKPPSYSSAFKFAQRFAPSPATQITSMSAPAGMRGFSVNIDTICSSSSCEKTWDRPHIEVFVARAAPYGNSAIVNYFVNDTERVYSRGGFTGDEYQLDWSFIGPDNQPVSSPEARAAMRTRFAEAAGSMAGDGYGSIATSAQGPDEAGVLAEGRTLRIYAFNSQASQVSNPVFSTPVRSLPASVSNIPFGGGFAFANTTPGFLAPGALFVCGSKLRLGLSGRIAAPTAKNPGKTKPYRYKYPTGRVVCI